MSLTNKEAVKLAVVAAREYKKVLLKVKYLLICKNYADNTIDCFEVRFPKNAFLHLTGLSLSDNSVFKTASAFFDACIEERLSERDIVQKYDAYTEDKLRVLPQAIDNLHRSKMSVVYNGGRPNLQCEKAVGTTNFCFALDLRKLFFVPASFMVEDVRNFGNVIYQVVAVLSAELDEKMYSKIRSVKKGVNLAEVIIPADYKNIVDLSNYRHS